MFAGNGHGATTTRASIVDGIPADVADFLGAERVAQVHRWGFGFSRRSESGAFFTCDVFEIFVAVREGVQFRFKMFDEDECVLETNDWEDLRAFCEDHKRDFATPGPYGVSGMSLRTVIAIHDGPDERGHSYVDGKHSHVVARCLLNADAARIARALNAFGPMLEILKTTAGNIRSLGPAGKLASDYEVWLAEVEAAIAKAEG